MPPSATSATSVAAVFTMVACAAGVVTDNGGITVQLKSTDAWRPKPSVSVSVSGVLAATATGWPEITPVAVLSARPAGKVPAVSATR